MPIRFACPHCRQKLSVARRKAGSTADCPRCQRTLTIPQPADEPLAQTGSAYHGHAAPGTTAAPQVVRPPAGESAIFLPDADEFAGLELVYDTTASDSKPPAPPAIAEVVVVPRRLVYYLGALLAVVALVAFAIGMVLGSTFVAQPAPVATTCRITGSVSYASGPRSRPDVSAVVILLPQTPHRPSEKVTVAGLRPTDSAAGDEHGLTMIRELGGGYARTDANGHFEIEVPRRGRYLVLVISHDKKTRSAGEAKTSDLAKLSPFFENASRLLGEQAYRLTTETITSDRAIVVTFDN